MTFIKGTPRSDVLLFPEAIDDYVSDDNPVRFIEAFVDNLDLQELGFSRTSPARTGRPAYLGETKWELGQRPICPVINNYTLGQLLHLNDAKNQRSLHTTKTLT